MKSVRKRRGVHALVLTGLVGVLTLGLATQAMACGCPQPAPVFAGANFKQQVGNNTVSTNVSSVGPNDTIVATLATGTFAGAVTCSDNTGGGYTNVIDQNGGTGRLVVCVKPAPHAAGITSVTATYPGFAGLSVLNVVRIPSTAEIGGPGLNSVGAGSNPTVSSGTIHISTLDNLLFGVVSNSNTANFVPDPGWNVVPGATTAFGSGAGRRNITPVYRYTGGAGPNDYAVTGTPPGHGLTGSGFWQAGIIQFHQNGCDT
jgi:hypothetical protein